MEAVTCANSTASLIFNVINVTTIFINILHLVVLISLQSLKDKSYKVLLVSLCLLDIRVNLAFLLPTDCSLRTFLDTSAPLPTLWNLILCIMLESGACVRFVVHCLSTYERYLAVCKPFTGGLNFFVRHLKKSMAGLAVFTTVATAGITAIQLSFERDVICIHSVYGPTNVQSLEIVVIGAVMICATPVVTCVLLTLTWREILHLHRTAPQHSTETKFAVKYVTVINVMFICLMVPSSVLYLVFSVVYWSQNSQPPDSFVWLCIYSQSLYATFNSLIYAGMCATYREIFVEVFIPTCIRCRHRATAVVPLNARTPQACAGEVSPGAVFSVSQT